MASATKRDSTSTTPIGAPRFSRRWTTPRWITTQCITSIPRRSSAILHHADSGTDVESTSLQHHAWMFAHHNWNFMIHGNAFVNDIQQSGPRGGDKFFARKLVHGIGAAQSGSREIHGASDAQPRSGDGHRAPLSRTFSARRDRFRKCHRGRPASARFLHGNRGVLRLCPLASADCFRFMPRPLAIRRSDRRRIRIALPPAKIRWPCWAITCRIPRTSPMKW